MRERGDLTCFHEPFMYDYYINRKIRVMPHFNAEEGRPVTYDAVRNMLLEQAESGPVFIKDMSYYVMPHILEDTVFADRLVNCVLIRDPVAAIPSYFKLDPEVTCNEIGLEAQARHFKALQAAGKTPVVIQAEDVRADTAKTVGALWDAIGLPPADHAFEWQNIQPKDWEQVDGWHGDVTASKGIRPISEEEILAQKDNFARLAKKHPFLQDLLDHHRPHYEMLKAHALRP